MKKKRVIFKFDERSLEPTPRPDEKTVSEFMGRKWTWQTVGVKDKVVMIPVQMP